MTDYAVLRLAIGSVKQNADDTSPLVSIDLPESDEEVLALINNLRRQLQEISAEISEGIPVGGDREHPIPIISLRNQPEDLRHVFATRTREAVHMSDVYDR
ncbi:MAG: hypothetical protein KC680_04580 [Candidatus Peregrinibacteria bacterium]|nr:hypothetical protein [Candidatus Peregrinibacteria bacterium]MCB9808629.1 hypothetical protein [Candidatus Peribacteria bacterium]